MWCVAPRVEHTVLCYVLQGHLRLLGRTEHEPTFHVLLSNSQLWDLCLFTTSLQMKVRCVWWALILAPAEAWIVHEWLCTRQGLRCTMPLHM